MSEENEQIDLLILLGTYKSFSEQLHNMKGRHSGIIKRKFNILHNHVRQYENSLDKTWLKDNGDIIEELSDAITDLVYMLRENVGKPNSDGRDNKKNAEGGQTEKGQPESNT